MAPPVNLAVHVPREENQISMSKIMTISIAKSNCGQVLPVGMRASLETLEWKVLGYLYQKLPLSFMKIGKTSLDKIFPHKNQMNGEEVFPLTRPIWKI